METKSDTIEDEGEKAWEEYKRREDNPYDILFKPEEYKAWDLGYRVRKWHFEHYGDYD